MSLSHQIMEPNQNQLFLQSRQKTRKNSKSMETSSVKTREKGHLPAPPLRASYTIEAAMLMPLFACLMVLLLLFFRILMIEWGVGVAIHDVAQNMALYGESVAGEEEEKGFKEVSKETVIAASSGKILAAGLPLSFVRGNLLGMDFSDTQVTEQDIDIVVSYQMPLPIGTQFFNDPHWQVLQRAKARRWTGYDPAEGAEDGDYVYVTKYGEDYHESLSCPYLAPSIRTTSAADIGNLRNAGGGKYHPCRRCETEGKTVVYYTIYGTVYHGSLSCSGLIRHIQQIEREEAEKSYRACPKCVE